MMQSIPLLQKVLAADWNELPSVIQRHYTVPDNGYSCVKGHMEIGYPNYLFPLIYLIHVFGGLIIKRGETIETRVKKTISSNGKALCWHRELAYKGNKKDFFLSRMIYLQDHELIESVRFGFGLRLKMSVEQGKLVYRSNGHVWQSGKLMLRFPDWLLLGHATIIEQSISDEQFSLDFSIRHPLWGISYWYRGVFHYCE